MYIFISFVAFLSFGLPKNIIIKSSDAGEYIYDSEEGIKKITPEEKEAERKKGFNASIGLGNSTIELKTDSAHTYTHDAIEDSISNIYAQNNKSYFLKLVEAQSFKFAHSDKDIIKEEFSHSFTKNIPKLMFVLLPLFALLLKLLYRRKKIFYVDHAIFAIHFHSFIFLNFIILNLATFVSGYLDYLSYIIDAGFFVYLFFALRSVYMQSFSKTILKYLLLLTSYSVIVFIGFIFNFLLSILLL